MNVVARPDHGTLLHAYCHRCEKWRVLDEEAFAIEFRAGSEPPDEVRCPDCGEYGLVKARLPEPRRPEATLQMLEQPPADFVLRR
jgi:DNA-directed RNA polymerase subunit RPC12/RpoP